MAAHRHLTPTLSSAPSLRPPRAPRMWSRLVFPPSRPPPPAGSFLSFHRTRPQPHRGIGTADRKPQVLHAAYRGRDYGQTLQVPALQGEPAPAETAEVRRRGP